MKTTYITLIFCLFSSLSANLQAQKYKSLENENRFYSYNSATNETEELEINKIEQREKTGFASSTSLLVVPKIKSPIRFNKSKRLYFLIEVDKTIDPLVYIKLVNIYPNEKTKNREIILGKELYVSTGVKLNGKKKDEQEKFTFTTEKIGVTNRSDDGYYILRWLIVDDLPAGEYYWQFSDDYDHVNMFGIDEVDPAEPLKPTPILKPL